MKKYFIIIMLLVSLNATAQPTGSRAADSIQREKIRKATQEDYDDMCRKLGITSKRPGPSGDPKAPNFANTDESKASPYASLPDPLVLKNGKKITSSAEWWNQRRPEIAEDFDREVYGRLPENIPGVKWEVVGIVEELVGSYPVVTKRLMGHVDNSSYPSIKVDIQLTVTTPANMNGKVPLMMEFGFVFPPGFRLPANVSKEPSWQEQLLAKGWGYAILVPTSYQADNGAGLMEGIIGLVNKGNRRRPDQWGALRAWAWGASRALDYLETDKDVDAKKVGIEGLSRYGKAAIVTMVNEPRFAIGFIGSSGAGGVKILRRVYGEQVENLASSGEYHWFAGNFIKYASTKTPNDLPVDAHELVALAAPRPVFISSGSPNVEGHWVDAKGMFLGGAFAGPVYTLLGKKDLGANDYPKEETALISGDLAFRQHAGGHTTGPNWSTFLQFASRYIVSESKPVTRKIKQVKGLKDYYASYFPIGVAVMPRALKTDEAQLVVQQFNSITAENAMKMGPIHPTEKEYFWTHADSIVAFAQQNKIKVRGHTLCWHSQTPAWFIKDSSGKEVSKEVLLQRLKDHITAVVSRYKGKIYAWDVANEVISDNAGEYFRDSPFYRICGEEFVAKAFQWAHEADPDAILFYNDYNEVNPVKREKIIRLIKSLQAAKIPIGGVGLQAHWRLTTPTRSQLDSTLNDFSQLGIAVQITELDISVYSKTSPSQATTADTADTRFTKEREQKQLEVYKMCFELFRKYKKNITGVTFWNISDRSSWLDNYPVRGRKDYPLLFDKNLEPKKAFWEVVKF